MERYRWYELGLPSSFKAFIAGLRNADYEDGKPFGFVRVSSDRGEQRFKFVWRSYLARVTLDSDGAARFEQIPSLSYCEISVFEIDEVCWLRVSNPPRSTKDLLNGLESLAGFGFSARPVTFLDRNRPPAFPKGSDRRLVSFKAIGSLPGEHAVARIEAASKEGIDLQKFSLLEGIEYAIDQLTYEITYKRTKGQVCFGSNGVLKISGQLSPLLLESLEVGLIESKNRRV